MLTFECRGWVGGSFFYYFRIDMVSDREFFLYKYGIKKKFLLFGIKANTFIFFVVVVGREFIVRNCLFKFYLLAFTRFNKGMFVVNKIK